MTVPASDLSPLLPALLDALSYTGTGVVVIGDRGGDIERWYANAPAAALHGYTLEEWLQISPLDTIAPEQRARVQQLSANFRAGQAVPPTIELSAVHKDGTLVPVEYAVGAIKIPGGLAYVLVMRDLGTQHQAELSLLEADRIGLVGALTAGFAHEINNPLTPMLLLLRALRKQLAALPDATRMVDDITTNAERIASNVRALQTLATRGMVEQTDLAAVVSGSLRLAAPTLEPCARVIRQIFPVRSIPGEESRLGQAVLAMLLFSSSGFDPDDTTARNRIVVSVEERSGAIVLEVSDNGRDLSTEEARRAFDPFFRSPSRGAGVGVGLAVARSVAATMGGEVTLAPRSGGGAVITMRLPFAS
jgi:PAS domain S-box-containing protein